MNFIKRHIRTIVYAALTVATLAYVVTAVAMTRRQASSEPFTGIDICIVDSARTGFVDAADIDAELGQLRRRAAVTPRGRINTLAIEQQLTELDKIESAYCNVLNNGRLRITVTPMQPVARVFDGVGSYYINSTGKRITADQRSRIDVPIVAGHFDGGGPEVATLLPMLRQIHKNPEFDALVAEVTKNRQGDIIIVPAVVGHVINFGDTSRVADKFGRLRQFYHEVMPVKGWDYYDTLTVKWQGRIVATRRAKRSTEVLDPTQLPGIVDDMPDDGTMLTVVKAESREPRAESPKTPQQNI